MWTNLRASARKNLRRLATRGDPKVNAREVISNLRAAHSSGTLARPRVIDTVAGRQTKGAQVAQVDPVAAVPVVKAVAVESQEERTADGKAEGAVEEAVEQTVEETVEETSDPSAGVEPEAPSAQPGVEPVGAPAPSSFSWGLTF